MERVTKIPTVFEATQQKVGEVYARAWLSLAAKSGNTAESLAELDDFVAALQQLPKLAGALESPRIPVAAKHKLLDRALQGRASRPFLNFAKVLVEHGRMNCLEATLHAARNLSDELAGEVRGVVTTAAEISDSLRNNLSQKLSALLGKKVVLSAQVDPQIIGGVVVRVGDTVYDASVANQLRQIKTKTMKRTADTIRLSMERFAVDA